MIMADVFKILFLVLGGLVISVCYWLLAEALFGRAMRRARDLYAHHPLRATLVGAATGVPILVISLALSATGGGPPQFFGLTMLTLLIMAGLLGAAGLARLVGEGLPGAKDEREPWRAVMRGGIVLSIVCLLPFGGWFIILPIVLTSGFGSLILVRFPARSPQRVPEPPAGVHA